MEDGSRIEGPQADLIAWIQLDNYVIIQNTPKIDLKTGRKETTPKKVGSMEVWLVRETAAMVE